MRESMRLRALSARPTKQMRMGVPCLAAFCQKWDFEPGEAEGILPGIALLPHIVNFVSGYTMLSPLKGDGP